MSKPPTRSGNPWPWVALIGIALVWGYLLLRSDNSPAIARQVPAAAAPLEVTRLVLVTPTETPTVSSTPTPRLVIVTATATATNPVPPCDQASEGQVCLRYAVTPTEAPIPMCDKITPSPYQTQTCRHGDGATKNDDETS